MLTRERPSEIKTIEQYLIDPPDRTEWVDHQIIEKNDMTFKHSKIQSRLDFAWRLHQQHHHQGGEVCVEVPCRTIAKIRRPDVAYITPELLTQYQDFDVLPQSFPLVAEVASPTDSIEDVFDKTEEYLQSQCLEVWLIIPKVKYILIVTNEQILRFRSGAIATTQKVLSGCQVVIDDLFA